jgi:intermediate cleaving peptidase 55
MRANLPEASLAAHFEYLCVLGGAERMAYVPVVASGSVTFMLRFQDTNDDTAEQMR